MTYQHRTTTALLSAETLGAGYTTSTILAYSSATPPKDAILTAELDGASTAAVVVVEGRYVVAGQAAGDNWVQIVYMDAVAIGTAVPGTNGVVDTSVTTWHKEFPAYPEMRVKAKDSGANDITVWITA